MHHLNEEHQLFEPIFTENQASLYLGNIYAVQDLNLLSSHKIGAVVTVCREAQIVLPDSIYHLKIPITDRPDFDLRETIQNSNQFIKQHIVAGRNVLVHCYMGKSRSTSLIASYLMLTQNINLEQALNLLKFKAPQCEPNPGFIRQLLLYERQIQGGISSILTKAQSQYYKVQDYPGMQATKQAPLKKVDVSNRNKPSKISHRVSGQGMTNNAFVYKNTLTLPTKLHQIALSHFCDEIVISPLFSSKNKGKKLGLRQYENKKMSFCASQANPQFSRGSTPILIQ